MIEYRIYKTVYNAIISLEKNIEIRLLNEKSSSIKVGDIIRFNVLDEDLHIDVIVTNKYVFNNIDELYSDTILLKKSSINSTKEEFENLLYSIFGKDKVINSKLVGIEFKIDK